MMQQTQDVDLTSLKKCSDSCRVLRTVCSDPLLNPWHHPVRHAIFELFTHHSIRNNGRHTIEYPVEALLEDHESETLTILAALAAFSCVPRSVVVDILALSPPRFLLYHSARSKLPCELWEQAFRRRFLPSWIPPWVRTSRRPSWAWQECFFRILEQLNHRLTSNCTSMESWTNYVVILRSGTAATCTAYSRTFSASVIMNDLKRQANLMEYETQARVIVQLADVRIVMLGMLRKPPYFAFNNHARELIHPPGVERPDEIPSPRNTTTAGRPQIPHPPQLPQQAQQAQQQPLPQGASVSSNVSTMRSSGAPRRSTFTTPSTRSPSRERRASIGLRLSRTLTHESTSSARSGESSSSRTGGIMSRIRRWTSGSDGRAEQNLSPRTSVCVSWPLGDHFIPDPSDHSRVTAPTTHNASTPLDSTLNQATSMSSRAPVNSLPRLQHPEPSENYSQYPNYTPGEDDTRWRIQNGLEEGGLLWVGPIMITAQLVPHNVKHISTPLTAEEVYSEGRHVSFRWDDLIAIAPWMEERLTRRDDGSDLFLEYGPSFEPTVSSLYILEPEFEVSNRSITSSWNGPRTLISSDPSNAIPAPNVAFETPGCFSAFTRHFGLAQATWRDRKFCMGTTAIRNPDRRIVISRRRMARKRQTRVLQGNTLFPDRDPYTMPVVSKSSLPELSSIIPRPLQSPGALSPPNSRSPAAKVIDIYVCTHGARDCRCGDIGGEIAYALRAMKRPDVRVFDIGHVGGHKWAGNVIVFPSGDWYGNLRPEDLPQLVDHITGPDRVEPWWAHWRGRMGLTKDMQSALHNAAVYSEHLDKSNTFPFAPIRRGQANRSIHTVKFVSWEGKETTVQASQGKNLMQVAKDASLEGVEGICGGNLECATCHMYISPSAPLPRMSDAEDDMLAYAIKRRDGESRLGCQIDVTPELAAWIAEGGRIELPRF
ncbi:sucrase/ferredoxin-like domain-containing protein [Rhizoctonia solani]|uniref:Sucrase/ferredoxin-like domain-containing protein n=1 Tax=Rhizoctonia solani TaxID=456999 RepID=A0A8H8NVK0_9AGAM|nr:sucrase/ferredoxin-like domain-containing protein [Rhizoctonia solani]QRW20866.1 sucrase/ferredoxin-like domain-containing protein [Rhizoctonia solani]